MLLALNVAALAAAPARAAVICQESSTVCARCGVPAYEWIDEKNDSPKAVAVLMHGLTQQGKSVGELAKRLAADNYLVLSLDQRGHGRWHFGEKHTSAAVNYNSTVKDLLGVCRAVKEQYPGLPVYCVGESAGSAVIAQAAANDPTAMDGIVLCSPGTRPRVFNPVWVVSDFLSNIYRLDHPIDLRRYINRYASEDPRIIEEMLSDPMSRYRMSGREILGTLRLIHHTGKVMKSIPADMPVLVVQGASDHILEPGTAQKLVHHRKLQPTARQLVVLPSLGHVLMGTAYIKPIVADTITDWLDTQVHQTASVTVTSQLAHSAKGENP